ncbi:MAG TPA: threonyl-tRNA synthetase editing domain-containing protein, partial [Sedimentisphaerales bacterium]|nr:threonyl-tRNA synthetase editing domain-containing protein [Sedimentisphaerales bacterium]
MILDSYQCSSCFFEDKEPSTRIDPSTISPQQLCVSFNNVLVVFICVERYDGREELEQAVTEIGSLLNMLGKRPIVLCPNVHLSIDKAPEKQAIALIMELEKLLKERGLEVHRLSFGYHKRYGLECNGNVGSVVGRRFYGSEHKQFLRLMTRLGVCPPESPPSDMPAWAHVLMQRQLKVLGNRRETYETAKTMLREQLDATGQGELWTCMLFEGERQPMEDYLSQLHTILQEYPD